MHGLKVRINGRTLKRPTTVVKHSRFLRNLDVIPILPPEPEPVTEIDQEGDENNDNEDDDEE